MKHCIAAQRFLEFYPGEEDAAYAQYLLALSYYDQIDQVGRDQVADYARRAGMGVEEAERWLRPSLAYEPDAAPAPAE